jgi:hypothetical protein
MSEFLDIVKDTLIDGLKLLPFLFITFILMELLEHKFGDKLNNKLKKVNKIGPIFGSMLGIIPQCGISASASNFYITRVISLGTLISVYLSTSDEMLPILIGHNASIVLIIKILLVKFITGLVFGFIIDLIFRKKEKEDIKDFCELEDCDCNHGVLKSSIIHTLKTFLYILIISFLLNLAMFYFGEDLLSKILMKNNPFGVIITSLIGLIPNCSSSVLLTELYLNDIISIGKLLSGVLVNAGVGLLILFRFNKNKKENFKIIGILLAIGVLVGFIFDILKITF